MFVFALVIVFCYRKREKSFIQMTGVEPKHSLSLFQFSLAFSFFFPLLFLFPFAHSVVSALFLFDIVHREKIDIVLITSTYSGIHRQVTKEFFVSHFSRCVRVCLLFHSSQSVVSEWRSFFNNQRVYISRRRRKRRRKTQTIELLFLTLFPLTRWTCSRFWFLRSVKHHQSKSLEHIMVLPFKSNTSNTTPTNGEPPRILTEEEQILVAIDQGVHEVRNCSSSSSSSSSTRFLRFFLLHAFLTKIDSIRNRMHLKARDSNDDWWIVSRKRKWEESKNKTSKRNALKSIERKILGWFCLF